MKPMGETQQEYYRGVRMVSFGTRRLRAIVHLDVDDAGITRAIAAFGEAVAELAGGAGAGARGGHA